jgi:hypothetical protein
MARTTVRPLAETATVQLSVVIVSVVRLAAENIVLKLVVVRIVRPSAVIAYAVQ